MTAAGLEALTPDLLQRMYVERRLSMRAIARHVGCSDSAVRARVRRLGLVQPGGPAPLPVHVVAELARLYEQERLDLRQVAARTGVPLNRISPELRRVGVRLRQRGSRSQEHLDPVKLRADYEAGATMRGLAVREGTDDGAIRAALLRAGATIRAQGGSKPGHKRRSARAD